MARRRREEGGGGESWLNTYADMVTLLLTFFVMLLSMSTVQQEKFEAFVRSLQGKAPDVVQMEPGDKAASDLLNDQEDTIDKLYTYLENYAGRPENSDVEVFQKDGVVFVRFNSDAFFEPDRATLRADSYHVLEFMAQGLKQYDGQIETINVCGHTASTGRQNSTVNEWMLSGERAATVATYLQEEQQIDPKKLIVMGYGKNYPIGDNNTEAGRRRNRRVELVIIGNQSGVDFDVYDALGQVYGDEAVPATGSAGDVLTPDTGKKQSGGESPSTADGGKVEKGVSPYHDGE